MTKRQNLACSHRIARSQLSDVFGGGGPGAEARQRLEHPDRRNDDTERTELSLAENSGGNDTNDQSEQARQRCSRN